MAITRSRNIPKKEEIRSVDVTETGDAGSKTVSSSDSKIDKTGGTDKVVKSKKTVRIPKNVEKQSRLIKGKSENGGEKQQKNTIKSEIFKSANIDTKGKKLPAYKVEQLQRLQKLINMSLVAKPRGPITYNDYVVGKEERLSVDDDTLRISLDKKNKTKISNVTNYDPVRQRLLEGALTDSERASLARNYETVRNYQNIRAPKLCDDLTLKKVLNEIGEENKSLKFWGYFNESLDTENFGNTVLLENERRLQMHEIGKVQKDNLLEQKSQQKNAQGAVGAKVGNDFEDAKHAPRKYGKINLDEVAIETDLSKMLEKISDNDQGHSPVNEEGAFNGLKLIDFTTIRTFDNERA